ncbi:MAG: tRNA 4-thiouridine(8) synthase ThiI [Candidatus Wallbacteria bacterium]|nr:tRNA 4-thiouridine(8) synthase ThiI [Candidatus Wallbacteria bacterium]
MSDPIKKKALALFSGGLDSTLAVLVARDAGAEVIGIKFTTPFFGSRSAETGAAAINLPLFVKDIYEPHLKILRNPKFGYGRNLNPCLDCHILMVKTAKAMLAETGADFLISGEVLGERPKSQTREALHVLEKYSDTQGLLLRPLSAKLLEPTIPELNGWMDREKLYEINGRSRKAQLELASRYGLTEFETPAGGCLLTEPNFCLRLKKILHDPLLSRKKLELLKCGRHFMVEGYLVVIGRNQSDNEFLAGLVEPDDAVIRVFDRPSPLTVVIGGIRARESALQKAAALTLRYSKYRDEKNVALKIIEQVIIIESAINDGQFERL